MTSPTRLQTEQAIEHIAADLIPGHKSWHKVSPSAPCIACQFIQTMADYIDNKVARLAVQVPALCYSCDTPMEKDKTGVVCPNCGAKRANGVEA
jgi:Zn finger protein HypA/HybF involved in hydrogenase expression